MNKVTMERIQSRIKSEMYMVLPDGRTTLCMLTLVNGYTIQGLSACVDENAFDLNIGRRIAHEDAIRQIWPLEGYLLAEQMHQASLDKPQITVETGVFLEDLTADAPYGYKKDGTPRSKPGRKTAAPKRGRGRPRKVRA